MFTNKVSTASEMWKGKALRVETKKSGGHKFKLRVMSGLLKVDYGGIKV
jgi:hypothetical protein